MLYLNENIVNPSLDTSEIEPIQSVVFKFNAKTPEQALNID